MLIDTHAHINMLSNPQLAIIEAKEAGVDEIIIPSAGVEDFDDILKLTSDFEKVYAALGVHPENCEKFDDAAAKRIIELVKMQESNKIVAIGEIGLDYYYSKDNKEAQKRAFISQLEIAKMLDLPVIIHDREAHKDTFDILVEMKLKKVLMHCYSGSVEFMKQCTNSGFKIALGGVVTFKNAKTIKDVASEIDIEDLMLETDCPYLTPHPFRGSENSPKYIGFVAKEIANLKNLTYQEVAKITSDNAKQFFNLN